MLSGNDSINLTSEMVGHFSFGTMDYVFFCGILLISVSIGIYFGFCTKQDNATEYLLAGKRMGYFPIAMSMVASHVSGITLLGVPSEVYQHGTQYAACIFTSTITCLITVYFFLPVFYKLQLPSTFEYLEVRFARPVRTLSSLLFTISLFMYIPIVVYVPALAFSQVTGLSLHLISPVLCTVCIVYTSIGGLKAVVWTDTIQFAMTVGGLMTVLILGVQSVGGISEVWRISEEGGRIIFFDMNPSPFVRNSFWAMTVGVTVTWLGHLGIHPGTVQRFLSVPREQDARNAMAFTGVGLIIVKLISVFTGLIVYAKYHDCDPLTTKAIKQFDQMLPYYVMDVAKHVPGLSGLFLAGLVSAALATMSAYLNTVSGTIYEDFIERWIPDSPTKEAKGATIMKIIVVIVGAISVGLVFVVERLGTVFQIAVSMRSVTDGPSLGLFILGMLVPWSNAKGALLGGCASLITMLWLVGGSQWHIAKKNIHYDPLPTSTTGCPYPLNETVSRHLSYDNPMDYHQDEPMFLYRISFMYYGLIGSMVVIVVGVIGSYVFGGVDLNEIDPDHISPIMKRFLPRRKYMEVALKATNEISTTKDGNFIGHDGTHRSKSKEKIEEASMESERADELLTSEINLTTNGRPVTR